MKKYLIFHFLALPFYTIGQYTIEKIHTFSDIPKSVHIEKIVFSPDGTKLLMNSYYAVYLYSMNDLTQFQRFKDHKYDIYWIGFAANNDFFYSWSHREYKLITRQSTDYQPIAQVEGVANFGWSHDNQWFVVANWRDSMLQFRNGRDFKLSHQIKSSCYGLPVFSKDDKYLFVKNINWELHCYQTDEMKIAYIFNHVNEFQLSPDGAYMACFKRNGSVVQLYRMSDFYPVCEFQQKAGILDLRWSTNGQYLLIWDWGDEQQVQLYDINTFKHICTLPSRNHNEPDSYSNSSMPHSIKNAAFSPNGKWFTFWTQTGKIDFYSLDGSVELIKTMYEEFDEVVIHPDGQHFAVLYNGDVILYKLSKK